MTRPPKGAQVRVTLEGEVLSHIDGTAFLVGIKDAGPTNVIDASWPHTTTVEVTADPPKPPDPAWLPGDLVLRRYADTGKPHSSASYIGGDEWFVASMIGGFPARIPTGGLTAGGVLTVTPLVQGGNPVQAAA